MARNSPATPEGKAAEPKRETFGFVNNRLDNNAISMLAEMIQTSQGAGSLQVIGGGEDLGSRAMAPYRKQSSMPFQCGRDSAIAYSLV